MIYFRTIEHAGGRTFLKYTRESRVADDDCLTLTSHEPARPEFHAALRGVCARLIDELELPAEWVEQMAVEAVTFDQKREFRSIGVRAHRILPASGVKMAVKMPDKPEHTPELANMRAILSAETMAAIRELEGEASKFLNGEREQGQLFAAVGGVNGQDSMGGNA